MGRCLRLVAAGMLCLAAMLAAGCGSTRPVTAAANTGGPLQQAAQRAVDTVLTQGLRRRALGGAFASWVPQALVLAPVIDTRQRQGSATAQEAARWISERIRRNHSGYVLVSSPPEAGGAELWQLRATLSPVDGGVQPGRAAPLRLALELVDARGSVLAAASEAFGTAQTSEELAGSAPPSDRVGAAQGERPDAALAPNAATLQAWSDEYLALLKRGREAEAQVVFGRIVAAGLASRSLGMRLLFAPGSAEFWPDPALTRQYAMWLAEIARQLSDSPHCLQVIGHSSRKGSEEFNVKLSIQRAQAVKQVLLQHAPALAPKVAASGVGWAQTIVGSGSDDQRDAADRRVEFRVVDCL